MKYVNTKQQALSSAYMASKSGRKGGFELCKICKNGKPGKPKFYETFGSEKTAQDVIDRLQKLNAGCQWVEA